MKHGKKPTKAQKIRLKELRLNYENWLVTKATTTGFEIVNRVNGNIRQVTTK